MQAGLPYVLQDSLSPHSLLHLERLAYEMGIIQHAPYQPPYPQGDLSQGIAAPAMLPQHQVRPSWTDTACCLRAFLCSTPLR